MIAVRFLEGNNQEAVITIRKRSWFGFGAFKSEIYRGSCTVWRDVISGRRPSTAFEMFLCGEWKKAIWAKEEAQ